MPEIKVKHCSGRKGLLVKQMSLEGLYIPFFWQLAQILANISGHPALQQMVRSVESQKPIYERGIC